MRKINWEEIRRQFEKEMAFKLQDLPGHREVPESLREFRHLISHQLPEIAPVETFSQLISLLLEGKLVNLATIRKKHLQSQLETEKQILDRFKNEFEELRKSAMKWIKVNFPENQLRLLWKEHKTWLPRRYTVYKDKNVSFQKIAVDTLARYALVKITARPSRNSMKKLLKKLEKLNLPKDKFAVYGSGPLGIRGIRKINDLDLVVTKELWKKLSKKYPIKHSGKILKIKLGEKIEVVGKPVCYQPEELIKSADVIDGIRFVNLEKLIKCKKKMGREKDFRDIKLIKNYLKKSPLT